MLRTEGSTHVDIITRAHHLTAPEAVIDSWAAASYAGLSYWTDTAPVTLLVRSGFYKTTDADRIVADSALPLKNARQTLSFQIYARPCFPTPPRNVFATL